MTSLGYALDLFDIEAFVQEHNLQLNVVSVAKI